MGSGGITPSQRHALLATPLTDTPRAESQSSAAFICALIRLCADRQAAILTSMGAVDVVHAGQSRANCFTKAYAKYCKGAGSICASGTQHTLTASHACPPMR